MLSSKGAPFWQQAEECISKFNYDDAIQIYRNALKMYSNDVDILDALGDTYLQKGDHDLAQSTLSLSIKLAPDCGAVKYLNLAQLLEGQEALRHYEKAFELLKIQSPQDEKEHQERRSAMNECLCAMAEIYLTDECFAENAESECGRLLSEALQLDPASTEALQLMCSYKISQQKKEEALQYLEMSRKTWPENRASPDGPSPAFRTATAKLYMELGQWETATSILDDILEEIDTDPESWYLAGFAYSHDVDLEVAQECLEKALLLFKQPDKRDTTLEEEARNCLLLVQGKLQLQQQQEQTNPTNKPSNSMDVIQ